jgi:pimeloyl-ACP methyl ester carboxylesterase
VKSHRPVPADNKQVGPLSRRRGELSEPGTAGAQQQRRNFVTFELPAPSAVFDVNLEDGAKIRVRRHGNPDGIRILLSHGNGFAVDAYFPYWRHFLERYDLVIFDFRNHGQNIPVEPSNHTYAQLSRDLERVVQEVRARLGAKKTIGIFHSFSARTAMKHAIEIGWRWDALLLFDPPDVPPVGHPNYAAMEVFERRLVEFAGKRRRHFASIDELTQEFIQSRATRNWVAGEHELMARSVLRKNPDGDGYVLVCAPENEASIYEQALTLNLWPAAKEFGGPVKLTGADPMAKGAPATAAANQALGIEGGYDYTCVEGTGHMQQIERPDECFRITMEFLAKHELA